MNDQLDDLTQCPACLEVYGDGGEHVPRILPCHCTLCEKCIKHLLNDDDDDDKSLTCPRDRTNHKALDGAKTFQQNKYIISYLKKTAVTYPQETKTSQTEAEAFRRCTLHDRELSLFCRKDQCKKLICTLCLVQEHSKHPFVDIVQEERNRAKNILEEIESLSECLQSKLTLLDSIKTSITHHEKYDDLEEKQTLIDRIKLSLLESINLDRHNDQMYKNFAIPSENFTHGATFIGCKGIIILYFSFQGTKLSLKRLENI